MRKAGRDQWRDGKGRWRDEKAGSRRQRGRDKRNDHFQAVNSTGTLTVSREGSREGGQANKL